MVFVYVLKSLKNGIIYVGISQDVSLRLKQHNAGKSKFTSGHKPWEVIYTEQKNSFAEARKREKYLKSDAGKRWLKSEQII